jgi:hypothetical protein
LLWLWFDCVVALPAPLELLFVCAVSPVLCELEPLAALPEEPVPPDDALSPDVEPAPAVEPLL